MNEEEVRDQDLEPYVTLRYIARLFKVLAVLMVVMLIGEVVTGLVTNGVAALMTLLGEATRFLVLAGLMWSGGDMLERWNFDTEVEWDRLQESVEKAAKRVPILANARLAAGIARALGERESSPRKDEG